MLKPPKLGDKNVFAVEKIIKERKKSDGSMEYFIKWKGYAAEENTWEPQENLTKDTLQQWNSIKAEKNVPSTSAPSGQATSAVHSLKEPACKINPKETKKSNQSNESPQIPVTAKVAEVEKLIERAKAGEQLPITKFPFPEATTSSTKQKNLLEPAGLPGSVLSQKRGRSMADEGESGERRPSKSPRRGETERASQPIKTSLVATLTGLGSSRLRQRKHVQYDEPEPTPEPKIQFTPRTPENYAFHETGVYYEKEGYTLSKLNDLAKIGFKYVDSIITSPGNKDEKQIICLQAKQPSFIYDAGIKGLGLKAGKEMSKGAMVGILGGELISNAEKLKRESSGNHGYFMEYDTKTKQYIDARLFGNETRFLNHNHNNPNVTFEKTCAETTEDKPVICVRTMKSIRFGEILEANYGEDYKF